MRFSKPAALALAVSALIACTGPEPQSSTANDPRAALIAALPNELGAAISGAAAAAEATGWTVMTGADARARLLGQYDALAYDGKTGAPRFESGGVIGNGFAFSRWGTQSNPSDPTRPLFMQFDPDNGPLFFIFERSGERLLVPAFGPQDRWISLRVT